MMDMSEPSEALENVGAVAGKKPRPVAQDNPYTASVLVRVEPSTIDELKAYRDRINGSRSGPRWTQTDVAREFLKRGLMQDWILATTPVAIQSQASVSPARTDLDNLAEEPFDGSVELIEIQDRLRRIQREGLPRDIRSAAKVCEQWTDTFRSQAGLEAHTPVPAPARPSPAPSSALSDHAAQRAVQAAPVVTPASFDDHVELPVGFSEDRLRKRATALWEKHKVHVDIEIAKHLNAHGEKNDRGGEFTSSNVQQWRKNKQGTRSWKAFPRRVVMTLRRVDDLERSFK